MKLEMPLPVDREGARADVVTKAVLRTADRLELTNQILAEILGLSPASISRMRAGAFAIRPGQKAYELATLLVRLYRSLDVIAGGEDAVSRSWLRSGNRALNARPIDLLTSVAGLVNVIAYVDAHRALV